MYTHFKKYAYDYNILVKYAHILRLLQALSCHPATHPVLLKHDPFMWLQYPCAHWNLNGQLYPKKPASQDEKDVQIFFQQWIDRTDIIPAF